MKFNVTISIPDNEQIVKSTFSLHIEDMPITNLDGLDSIKDKVWNEFLYSSGLYGSEKLKRLLEEKGRI